LSIVYDKRGVGGSSGDWLDATMVDALTRWIIGRTGDQDS